MLSPAASRGVEPVAVFFRDGSRNDTAGHDEEVWVLTGLMQVDKDIEQGWRMEFLSLFSERPDRAHALACLDLNSNRPRRFVIGGKDVDACCIPERNRRDETAPRRLCGNEVFASDSRLIALEMHDGWLFLHR